MTNKRKVRRAKNLNSKRKELFRKRRNAVFLSNFWTVTESQRASSLGLVRMHGVYVRQLVNLKKWIADIFNSAEN